MLRVIEFTDRAKEAFDYIDFIENRKLHRDFWQLLEMSRRDRSAFAVLKKKIDDEVSVNAVSRQPQEHGEITGRPDYIAEASLHKVSCQC